MKGLRQSIQPPHDPFNEQRAGDHAQEPVHLGPGEILIGSAFYLFDFGPAFDCLAERRSSLVAMNSHIELAVIYAAGFFGEGCKQRVVSFDVRALSIRNTYL